MKVLVFFNSMAPAGGIERVISKHIQFLSEQHSVVLLTYDDKESFYSLPDKVVHDSLNVDSRLDMNSRLKRIYKIGLNFFIIVKKLKEKIKYHKPDLIYVASPLGVLQIYCSGFNSAKIYVTEHSSFSAYNSLYKKIALKLYKKVGLLTVPTTDDSKFYQSVNIKNFYVPNPLPFFPEQTSDLTNKSVLNIGRFTDDKRHLLLLDIWAKVKNKDLGWKLTIIGKGENEIKIKEKIEELKLQESVILLEPIKDIQNQYLKASLFALTSRAEGFGLVLAEAQVCGVPCVSFNCPSGPKDIIDNDKNGYLIDEGDVDGYVVYLDKLMDDYDLRKQMGAQSWIDVQKFEEKIISQKINDLVIKYF